MLACRRKELRLASCSPSSNVYYCPSCDTDTFAPPFISRHLLIQSSLPHAQMLQRDLDSGITTSSSSLHSSRPNIAASFHTASYPVLRTALSVTSFTSNSRADSEATCAPLSEIESLTGAVVKELNIALHDGKVSDLVDSNLTSSDSSFVTSCHGSRESLGDILRKERVSAGRFLAISMMDILGLFSLLILGIILSSSWSAGSSLSDSPGAAGASRQAGIGTPLFSHTPADAVDAAVAGAPDPHSFRALSSLSREHNAGDESRVLKRMSGVSLKRIPLDAEADPGRQEAGAGSTRRLSGMSSNVDESTNRAYPHQGHHKHETRENHPNPSRRVTGKNAFLKREMLQNTSVTCNDGTTAGYYIRSNPSSRRWLVFLEGGWHCFSQLSCHQRWSRARPLMTSAHWPQMKSVGGIFSLNPEENPFWSDANHVLIPYCSSDSWSGDVAAQNPGDFSFLGSRIVEQVMIELLPQGLMQADLLMLAGSSAGAAGVLVNLDRIADLMSALGSDVQVRGLADSGWFLDNKPFDGHQRSPVKNTCQSSPHTCAPAEGMKLAVKHWNGRVPSACLAQYPDEPWLCYFGYRIYQTLRTPVFVVQWVFDEAQMTVNNVGNPVTKAQWNYIYKLGQDLRQSLENVTALFAPSCVSHTLLTKRSWIDAKINRVSLPEALRCWEFETMAHRHSQRVPVSTHAAESAATNVLRPNLQQQVSSSSLASQIEENRASSADASGPRHERGSRKRKRKRKHRQRHHHMKNRRADGHRQLHHHHGRHENKICRHRLIDHCSWPQCNRACPRLFNPLTGKEMDFLELFKTLGLNMAEMAEALGIDKATLSRMDRDSLLQLLTQ